MHWNPEGGTGLATDESRGIWNLYDREKNCALYWINNTFSLPPWEAASPFRIILHWLALQHKRQLIHSACIQFGDAAALLTGAGGSGKSTTTAAAIESGYTTCGDDFVLLNPNLPLTCHAVYDTINLTEKALQLNLKIGDFACNLKRDVEEKIRVHLQQAKPTSFTHSLQPEAIYSVRVGHRKKPKFCPVARQK